MNAFIGWLNRHVVPIAAKIGSIRWLVALRDAFIAIMPAMMAGAVSTVLNVLIRDIPTQFKWMGIVDSMQWLIGINAMVDRHTGDSRLAVCLHVRLSISSPVPS